MPGTVETGARLGLGRRLAQVRGNRLVQQNVVLFAGGLVAGSQSFQPYTLSLIHI